MASPKQLTFSGNLKTNGLVIHRDFEWGHLYKIAITNLAGQKLYTSEFKGSSEIQLFDVDTPLSSGIYLVSITDENNVASTRTIKVLKQ